MFGEHGRPRTRNDFLFVSFFMSFLRSKQSMQVEQHQQLLFEKWAPSRLHSGGLLEGEEEDRWMLLGNCEQKMNSSCISTPILPSPMAVLFSLGKQVPNQVSGIISPVRSSRKRNCRVMRSFMSSINPQWYLRALSHPSYPHKQEVRSKMEKPHYEVGYQRRQPTHQYLVASLDSLRLELRPPLSWHVFFLSNLCTYNELHRHYFISMHIDIYFYTSKTASVAVAGQTQGQKGGLKILPFHIPFHSLWLLKSSGLCKKYIVILEGREEASTFFHGRAEVGGEQWQITTRGGGLSLERECVCLWEQTKQKVGFILRSPFFLLIRCHVHFVHSWAKWMDV